MILAPKEATASAGIHSGISPVPRVPGRRRPLKPRGKCLLKFVKVCSFHPPAARAPVAGGGPSVPPIHAYSQGGGARLSIIHAVSRAFVTTWSDFRAEFPGQEAAVMAVSGRAGPGQPIIWGATPAAAGPGFPPLPDTWAAGSREDFGVGGTPGARPAVLLERRGNFPACPALGAETRAGARSNPFPPLRLRCEGGFPPDSPTLPPPPPQYVSIVFCEEV